MEEKEPKPEETVKEIHREREEKRSPNDDRRPGDPFPEVKAPPIRETELTKAQRYRARNKEKLAAKEEGAEGKKVKCPHCGQELEPPKLIAEQIIERKKKIKELNAKAREEIRAAKKKAKL